MTQAYNAGS